MRCNFHERVLFKKKQRKWLQKFNVNNEIRNGGV